MPTSTSFPTRKTFSVTAKETGKVYHFGDANQQNLPGTARTLDRTNGSVSLKPGFVSRSGWTLIDDTSSLLFTPEGWLTPRTKEPGYQDLYLLISGHDYKAALADYQKLAGRVPLIPRYMLGNWWSRFWEYSDADIRALVQRFQKEQIPLSVFIIDMDWHITQTRNRCSGWTGFSWNRKLIPEPEKLLTWLHDQHLCTALNLHPAEGVHAHEDQYAAVAQQMGIDPQTKQPVEFDITDPKFAGAYFDLLLHPLEKQGVDFWWVDWQQGHLTRIPSLDPLWWLNHLHYQDLGRDGVKRPVVFSRWGGPGSHRYPIGFSGDTIISWRSLALQPYFTSSAANAAYGWWSHDIGGHMLGKENAELYTRWVQFGILSPIFRLHSTKAKNLHHLPWGFDEATLKIVRETMQLRNALVPYLYSMAHRCAEGGLPLCTPLYYEWPEEETAYRVPNEYLFGDQLLAAPVTRPADHRNGLPAIRSGSRPASG
jgi:alpha-glucosidase (family GH31 glycosyl hydrolase)